MVAHWSIPLAQPPRIIAIDVGTYVGERGRYACDRGHWRLQLYLTPAMVDADGLALGIRSGCVGVWPPEVALGFSFEGRLVHACSHFSLAAADDDDDDAMPLVQDLGSRFERLHAAFLEAVTWSHESPDRARARLWDLLWEVSAARETSDREPPLARALLFIERHLREELPLDGIARAADCSRRQLLRLFRQSFATTVVGYVRRRRVEVAARLLRTTALPLTDIAARVGIPDPHLFTKTVRRELGAPPRTIRAATPTV